jgi:hypothetical protein
MVAAMSFNWKRIRCITSRSAAGREGRGQHAVFFTTEVDVAALAQQEQGQACDHDKSEYEFPHFLFSKKSQKKAPGTWMTRALKYHKALQPEETGAGRWARPGDHTNQSLA